MWGQPAPTLRGFPRGIGSHGCGGRQAHAQPVWQVDRQGASSPGGTPWARAVWSLQDQGKPKLPFIIIF